MAEPEPPSLTQLGERAARDLADAESQVKAALAGVDARAAFASYALYRLYTADGHQHGRPAPAAVEQAAWLLYPYFENGTGRDGAEIQAIIDAIEVHATALTFSEMFSPEQGEADQLQTHLRLHSGIVRGSAYPHQIMRRIEMLLRPFEDELAAHVGIGPWRATEIIKTLGMVTDTTINRDRANYAATGSRHNELASKKNKAPQEDAELIELSSRLAQIADYMGGAWVPSKEVLRAAGCAFTDAEWDGLCGIVGMTPAVRSTMSNIADVQDRPLFFLDEAHAFYVHGGQCFDAIFTAFDEIARNDPGLRDRYGDAVARWMETEIAQYAERLFPAANILQSACFPDPDHIGGEAEADVVIVWVPFLIVLEAKGKRVSREALRGSRAKLRNSLRANIQDSFYQARRVIRVLERDGKVRFKERRTGHTSEVTREQLRRVMPISVTLQHLSGVPTQLAITQRLGLFKGNAYPWSVSIDDLDVITRFASSPDIFLHYVERRTAHQHASVSVSGDELNMFGHYLDNRLHASIYEERSEIQEHEGPTLVSFDGGEERFEPFYVAELYGRPPPNNAPTLDVPSEITGVLDELRTRSDAGARWIAFALLGLSPSALAKLNAGIRELRKIPAEGRQMPRVTAKEGDVLINVMAHAGLDEATFRKNATFRTRLEQYASKASAAVTIGINQRDQKRPFDLAVWSEAEWVQDETLDRLVTEDRATQRTMRLLTKGKKPGRNDPCPCGSGKKLKRCCGDRLTFG